MCWFLRENLPSSPCNLPLERSRGIKKWLLNNSGVSNWSVMAECNLEKHCFSPVSLKYVNGGLRFRVRPVFLTGLTRPSCSCLGCWLFFALVRSTSNFINSIVFLLILCRLKTSQDTEASVKLPSAQGDDEFQSAARVAALYRLLSLTSSPVPSFSFPTVRESLRA